MKPTKKQIELAKAVLEMAKESKTTKKADTPSQCAKWVKGQSWGKSLKVVNREKNTYSTKRGVKDGVLVTFDNGVQFQCGSHRFWKV